MIEIKKINEHYYNKSNIWVYHYVEKDGIRQNIFNSWWDNKRSSVLVYKNDLHHGIKIYFE